METLGVGNQYNKKRHRNSAVSGVDSLQGAFQPPSDRANGTLTRADGTLSRVNGTLSRVNGTLGRANGNHSNDGYENSSGDEAPQRNGAAGVTWQDPELGGTLGRR